MQNIYSNEDRFLFCLQCKESNAVIMLPGPPREWCPIRSSTLVSTIDRLVIQQQWQQVSLGEGKSMHNLHPCHYGYCVHNSLTKPYVAGKDANICSTCHFVYLIIENLFLLCPLVIFHIGHQCLHTLYPLQEVHSHTTSPDVLVTSLTILFQVPDHPAKPQQLPMNPCRSGHLLDQSRQANLQLEVMSTGKNSFTITLRAIFYWGCEAQPYTSG